jgi:hypothetical protein
MAVVWMPSSHPLDSLADQKAHWIKAFFVTWSFDAKVLNSFKDSTGTAAMMRFVVNIFDPKAAPLPSGQARRRCPPSFAGVHPFCILRPE